MVARLDAVTYATRDPHRVGRFWGGLLDRAVVDEDGGVLVPGEGTQVGLRFVEATSPAPDRLHLHVTSTTEADQRRTLDDVRRLGGRLRGTRLPPLGRDLYLADPDGNEFCLIEPGNAYLAGCGLLGEVTCEGTRATGAFWRDALGWPFVWDEGDQTVVQSPDGGTKIAWDVGEGAPTVGGRQRFDLVADDPAAEAERLLALGASSRGRAGTAILLVDPDGMELTIRASASAPAWSGDDEGPVP